MTPGASLPSTAAARLAAAPEIASALVGDFGSLLVAVVLCTIFLAALAVYALRWEAREDILLFFALLVGIYGVRLFAKTSWPELLLGIPRVKLDHFVTLADDLIFLPAIPFFRRTIRQDRWGLFRILWWAALVFAAGTFPYKIVTGDWGAAAGVKELLVLSFLAASVVNVFPSLVGGRNADVRVFAVGSLVFTAFVVNGHLVGNGLVPWRADPEPLGFLTLVGFLGFIVARRSLAAERRLQAVAAELETARQIQESILPRSVPSGGGLTVAARYVPATEVGGDFYDFLVPSPGQVGILIADVSGHGVPAALVASMIKMALAAQMPVAREPALLLGRLNELFCGRLRRQFLTAAYAYFDAGTRTLKLAGAGHPALILCRSADGTAEAIDSLGPLIGRFSGAPYRERDLSVSPGDRLLLYTDGVTEARNRRGDLLGEDNLRRIVAEHRDLPPGPFLDRVIRRVSEWSEDAVFDDDVTLIVLDC